MTVNYTFDLENDDFLDDTFRSIPEEDLLSYSVSSPVSKNLVNNDFEAPGPSVLEQSSINTDKKEKYLSFLFKNRENVSAKKRDLDFKEICSPNKSVNVDISTINSRFVPGYIPKPKKSKLPGHAGFFIVKDGYLQPVFSGQLTTKGTTADIEIQNITNPYFTSEDLLLLSWQNLQVEVSSCHNLLSTAKYYSIHRILYEASKKKLPKHLIVPVLCVLIKKFPSEEEIFFVLMDDTGEISGKIDKDVLDMYKDVIQEKTALILKRVTCICNVLILEKQNVLSIYCKDGSVKHVQDLNFILDNEELLKPMNCQCPGASDEKTVKKLSFFEVCNSTPVSVNKSHKTSKKVVPSLGSSAKSLNKSSYNVNNTLPCPQIPVGKEKDLNILDAMLDVSRKDCKSGNSTSTISAIQTVEETFKSVTNIGFESSTLCSKEVYLTSETLNTEAISSNNSKSKLKVDTVNNSSFPGSILEEDFFCEDEDDFDNMLCSLDEKSFLQGM